MSLRIDSVLPGKPFGDSLDGDLEIPSSTTYSTPTTNGYCLSGDLSITVLSTSGFSVGDVVLIHQTRGTDAGGGMINRIKAVNASSFDLDKPASRTFYYDVSGGNKCQVIKIKRFRDVLPGSSVTLTAPAWNGETGGILTFAYSGRWNPNGNTFTVDGSGGSGTTGTGWVITANKGGFRGGDGNAQGAPPKVARQGESYTAYGSILQTANNGGGGAASQTGAPGRVPGGSAGHAASGNAGSGASNGTAGAGGNSYGQANLETEIHLGSGGGGAAREAANATFSGGNGGAIAIIWGKSFDNSGGQTTINMDGGAGGASGLEDDGGCGSGGSFLGLFGICKLGSSLITALGKTNGNANSSSVGRIRIVYNQQLTGTANPSASTLQDPTLFEPAGSSLLALM